MFERSALLLPLMVLFLFALGCNSSIDTPLAAPAAATVAPAPHPSGLQPLAANARGVDAEILLGKDLFEDGRLSGDGTVSCASCHVVAEGGDDGRRTAVGIAGAVGPINTPTVLNAGLNFAQFWDGRAGTLVEQVAGPIHNELEMGSSWKDVTHRLNGDVDMVDRFERVYGGRPTAARVARAIAAYEDALVATGSPFDRYLLGDRNAISAEAKRGFERFVSLGCVACHQGRNLGGNMYQRLGVIGDYFADRGDVTEADYGRYNVTGREEDRYHFKVPSLRNVADTAPYFHDGSAATLKEAVATMVKYQLGRSLSEHEITEIVAFLETLSGSVDEALL